jgi:hypothetical protein
MFIYGLYTLITGKYWMWFARRYHLSSKGVLVRGFGLLVTIVSVMFFLNFRDPSLFGNNWFYIFVVLLITALVGLVIQSQAKLVKK